MTSSGIPLSLVQIWLEYLHWQGRSPHTLNAYLPAWQHQQWYGEATANPATLPPHRPRHTRLEILSAKCRKRRPALSTSD